MTPADLIYAALRIGGILGAPDRTPADSELGDALKVLNSMLDSWQIERLMVYAFTRNLYSLMAGQQDYQIGPGATDFDTIRPVRIELAGLIVSGTNPSIELPVAVLTLEQWKAIPVKSTPSTLPRQLYYEAAFPIGVVHLFPVPTISNQLVLYGWPQVLPQFETADQELFLPPGYQRCLEYNLAVELSPRYPKFKLSPMAVEIARESKDQIKSVNAPRLDMESDALFLSGGGSRWNWLTGDYL